MLTICKEINKQQKPEFDASKMSAMDIGCGYHSYMFAIARCQAQVNIIRALIDNHLTTKSHANPMRIQFRNLNW